MDALLTILLIGCATLAIRGAQVINRELDPWKHRTFFGFRYGSKNWPNHTHPPPGYKYPNGEES